MDWAEAGGSRQDHHIHAAIEDFLIRIEADETFVRLDFDLGG